MDRRDFITSPALEVTSKTPSVGSLSDVPDAFSSVFSLSRYKYSDRGLRLNYFKK